MCCSTGVRHLRSRDCRESAVHCVDSKRYNMIHEFKIRVPDGGNQLLLPHLNLVHETSSAAYEITLASNAGAVN